MPEFRATGSSPLSLIGVAGPSTLNARIAEILPFIAVGGAAFILIMAGLLARASPGSWVADQAAARKQIRRAAVGSAVMGIALILFSLSYLPQPRFLAAVERLGFWVLGILAMVSFLWRRS